MKELSAIAKAANAIGWIEALIKHGSEFKQGKQELGNISKGFCCLGFGCFVLGIRYQSEAGGSEAFASSVGLQASMGDSLTHGRKALYILNDDDGKTFEQIGVIMKNEPEAYFRAEVAAIIKQMYADGVV